MCGRLRRGSVQPDGPGTHSEGASHDPRGVEPHGCCGHRDEIYFFSITGKAGAEMKPAAVFSPGSPNPACSV